jgi:hypothetical protein
VRARRVPGITSIRHRANAQASRATRRKRHDTARRDGSDTTPRDATEAWLARSHLDFIFRIQFPKCGRASRRDIAATLKQVFRRFACGIARTLQACTMAQLLRSQHRYTLHQRRRVRTMQSSAAKEDRPDSTRPPRNWRHRKLENARRRQAVNERAQLVADFVEKLGGRVSLIQRQDVERVVDMLMLAKTARADLAAGKATINDVVKLENAADRAIRRLGLPPPGRAAPAMGLHDIVAKHTAAGDG